MTQLEMQALYRARERQVAERTALINQVRTPRTTGGKPRLLGISKRGNRYPRKNLIHGHVLCCRT
jgi:hypothetical protein